MLVLGRYASTALGQASASSMILCRIFCSQGGRLSATTSITTGVSYVQTSWLDVSALRHNLSGGRSQTTNG